MNRLCCGCLLVSVAVFCAGLPAWAQADGPSALSPRLDSAVVQPGSVSPLATGQPQELLAFGGPALRVGCERLASGGLKLQWPSLGPALAYSVQARDRLGDGLWVLAAAEAPWPTASTEWSGPMGAPMQFYRVLAVPAAQRGRILSSTVLDTLNRVTIQWLFDQARIPVSAQYDVQVYKLVYETIGPWGGRTWASGTLAVPLGLGVPLPLASYQHGTIVRTNDAPSSGGGEEVFVAIAFATTGYVGVLADYLGLGTSEGLHPYHHARSEATACIDLLRAVRAFCVSNGWALNGQLFLCGYSQGGHATMALHRELELYHTNEFTVTASAPMAGAYDLSGVTTQDALSGRPQPNPYYFAYLLAAYQSVYRFAPSLADLLAPPWQTSLPPLFLGNSSGSQINAVMPSNPTLILKPEILAEFQRNPHHPFRVALRDNDVYAWTPRAPMRLYHCSGDRDVVPANSQVALASFHSRGATQVQLIDPVPGGDHGACAMPSLLAAKAWFDSLRR